MLTSNVFAILGLRAMYFLPAAVASKLHTLTYRLAAVLAITVLWRMRTSAKTTSAEVSKP